MELHWDGLGLPHWDDVIRTYARPQPSAPLLLRGLDAEQKQNAVLTAMELSQEQQFRVVRDVFGRDVILTIGIAMKKCAGNANHASFAGWIGDALVQPLEVWRRADDGITLTDKFKGQLRDHFFCAYTGSTGVTSFLLVAVTTTGKFINAFTLTSTANANNKRWGELRYIGYDPYAPLQEGPLQFGPHVF